VLPAIKHKWARSALAPARHACTRLTYPRSEGMEGWVELRGWLYAKMVKLSADRRPSNERLDIATWHRVKPFDHVQHPAITPPSRQDKLTVMKKVSFAPLRAKFSVGVHAPHWYKLYPVYTIEQTSSKRRIQNTRANCSTSARCLLAFIQLARRAMVISMLIRKTGKRVVIGRPI